MASGWPRVGEPVAREDVEVVRAIYERWQHGDPAMDLLDPDIQWSTAHPDAGGIHGREEVVAFLRRYVGTFEDYRIVLEEIRSLGDNRVQVRFSESGRGKGSGVETGVRATGVWTVRDGRATRFRAELDSGNEPLDRAAKPGA
jgi:ketosteroid isomerase-like protein